MHATRVRIVGRGNKLWKTGWTLFVKRVTIGHLAINHQISVLGMKAWKRQIHVEHVDRADGDRRAQASLVGHRSRVYVYWKGYSAENAL